VCQGKRRRGQQPCVELGGEAVRQCGIVVLGMLGGSRGRKHPNEVATAQAVATTKRARKLEIFVARDVFQEPAVGLAGLVWANSACPMGG